MNDEEVRFWAKQAENDMLIRAVRADRERAIKFFGKAAVSDENEAELYRALDAHEIINSRDDELLAKMNRVPDSLIDQLNDFPPSERQEIEQQSRFSIADVLAIKKQAQEYLERLSF